MPSFMPRGPVCWPHQSTNTFCPVGAVVQQVLCAVVHLCPNLVEMIIIVLDHCDTNLESFEQVVCPQASTNTLLQKARSGILQLLQIVHALTSDCFSILKCHLTLWTRSHVICRLWPRMCHGDHVCGVLCRCLCCALCILVAFLVFGLVQCSSLVSLVHPVRPRVVLLLLCARATPVLSLALSPRVHVLDTSRASSSFPPRL